MKSINFIYTVLCLTTLFLIGACEESIETDIFSEISSDTALNSESGISSVLFSAYANSVGGDRAYLYLSSMASGEAWSRKGQIEPDLASLSNFTWTSDLGYISELYNSRYDAIRDANIVIDNISNENFADDFKKTIDAEARFVRGWNYAVLYKHFGPVPLYRSSSTDSLSLPRASDQDVKTLIEQDLLSAIENLPNSNAQEFGRATKGSAMGVLCKFYLNSKEWQKCADIAQDIMDLGTYGLIEDYKNVFSLDNEGNQEILWALTYKAQGRGHNIVALTFPTDYPSPYPNASVYAAEKYLFDDFVNSFEEGDERSQLIVTDYINTSGEEVQLLGNDMSLPYKYEFDPEASGATYGNDIPVVRYADILLARAESLNELNGPSTEVIDLINLVRNRAGASLLPYSGFTKESLRTHLFKERDWEFFSEAKRREDLIRQGTFISSAQSKGKNAQSHHVVYPIPQTDIDANPDLVQNEGY